MMTDTMCDAAHLFTSTKGVDLAVMEMAARQEQGVAFLKKLWQRQAIVRAANVFTVAIKDHENQWEEHFIPEGALIPDFGEYATYFSVNGFRDEARRKELTQPGTMLWQDLDEVRPEDCPQLPTVSWETSPDRFQALWFLNKRCVPERLERLNKALNRDCGADKGTWNLTRVLRVPFSYNGKRDCWVSAPTWHD